MLGIIHIFVDYTPIFKIFSLAHTLYNWQ